MAGKQVDINTRVRAGAVELLEAVGSLCIFGLLSIVQVRGVMTQAVFHFCVSLCPLF